MVLVDRDILLFRGHYQFSRSRTSFNSGPLHNSSHTEFDPVFTGQLDFRACYVRLGKRRL